MSKICPSGCVVHPTHELGSRYFPTDPASLCSSPWPCAHSCGDGVHSMHQDSRLPALGIAQPAPSLRHTCQACMSIRYHDKLNSTTTLAYSSLPHPPAYPASTARPDPGSLLLSRLSSQVHTLVTVDFLEGPKQRHSLQFDSDPGSRGTRQSRSIRTCRYQSMCFGIPRQMDCRSNRLSVREWLLAVLHCELDSRRCRLVPLLPSDYQQALFNGPTVHP